MQAGDERLGLPSASIIERLALCPGSWKMSRGLPEITTPELQAWSEAGDRIHLWLEAPNIFTLPPEELDVARRCLAERQKLMLVVQEASDAAAADFTTIVEKRLWLRNNGRKQFSGKIDFAAYSIFKMAALVVDYKTNRGDVAAAADNLQLRAGAVLLWLNLEKRVHNIYAAIIQPLVGKPELTGYGTAELEASLAEIKGILERAKDKRPRITAGQKQCAYCPARLACPAAQQSLDSPAVSALSQFPGAKIKALLDRWAVARIFGKTLEAQARELLKKAPDAIPGYELTEGEEVREVTDVSGLKTLLLNLGMMDGDDFMEKVASVKLSDLQAALIGHCHFPEREARKFIKEHCEPFITRKQKQGSISRTKT